VLTIALIGGRCATHILFKYISNLLLITRIILTGYATMEASIKATNQEIDGFLTKPFDNVELRANIHYYGLFAHTYPLTSEKQLCGIFFEPRPLQIACLMFQPLSN
jgi:hypothetical protein